MNIKIRVAKQWFQTENFHKSTDIEFVMLFTATASYQPPSATVKTLISTMGNPNVNLFI